MLHAETGREQEGKPDLLLVKAAFHTGKGCSLLRDVGGHVGEKVNILSMVLELLCVPLSSQNTLLIAEVVESDNEYSRSGLLPSSAERAGPMR